MLGAWNRYMDNLDLEKQWGLGRLQEITGVLKSRDEGSSLWFLFSSSHFLLGYETSTPWVMPGSRGFPLSSWRWPALLPASLEAACTACAPVHLGPPGWEMLGPRRDSRGGTGKPRVSCFSFSPLSFPRASAGDVLPATTPCQFPCQQLSHCCLYHLFEAFFFFWPSARTWL